MELKRRFIHNDDQHQSKSEEGDGDDLLTSIEQHTLPGIPPRKFIHGKPQKKAAKLTVGYTLSLIAVISVLGASGWWMKTQLTEHAKPVLTPEVKKLEPNKEVQKQPSMPNHETLDKSQQSPKQTVAAQLPAKVSQQLQASEASIPATVKKAPAKPVYKKIIRHKVGAGETLYRISVKYYDTGRYAPFLGRYNRIRDPSNLISGTFIKIPFPPGK